MRQVYEIVCESRGKLIGGSLPKRRKANSRPSESEGGYTAYPKHDCTETLCKKLVTAISLLFVPL